MTLIQIISFFKRKYAIIDYLTTTFNPVTTITAKVAVTKIQQWSLGWCLNEKMFDLHHSGGAAALRLLLRCACALGKRCACALGKRCACALGKRRSGSIRE